jgi:MoaA/NifB/PqqE/SkfB family radical SAM enzyme
MDIADYLSVEILKSIVTESLSLGLKRLYITGGEPFLYLEGVLNILNTVGDGVQTTIFTNGCESKASIQQYGTTLLSNVTFRLTVFAASPSLHDSVTGISGSFDNLMEASIFWLSNDARIEWVFIPLALNILEFDQVHKLAYQIGVDSLEILRLVKTGRALEHWVDLEPSENDWELFENQISNIVNHDTKTSLMKQYKKQNDHICKAGKDRVFIQANGDTYPCPALRRSQELKGPNVHMQSMVVIQRYVHELCMNHQATLNQPKCAPFSSF